ncbi:MAG: NUDIX domain-containing protein [Bacilli bacterium]|nr:NUDIX domain-containing protein [Bacilli bacterium]
MEYLGLYDNDGNDTGERIDRSKKREVPKGRYFRIVLVFIQNHKGEFLIQKVSKEKGNEYATTGGHVQDGTSSLDTAKQEVLEELGLDLETKDFDLFKTEKRSLAFQDCYYVKKDIDIKQIILQEEEVESVEWMTIQKIEALIEQKNFRIGNQSSFAFLIENYLSNQN